MSHRPKIFYGWCVVAACALGLFFTTGPVVVLSFGVFLKPLVADFRVGRTAVSFAITVHNLISAMCTPFIGGLIDRWGPRRVILLGMTIFPLVLISGELLGRNILYLYLFYGALGLISGSVAPVPYGVMVSRWFDRRRGLALGLTMFGVGLGAITLPLAAHRLIVAFNWRTAYATFGCAALLIALPVMAVVIKNDPKDKGLLPDGTARRSAAEKFESPVEGFSWPEIRTQPTFWILLGAFFLAGASVHAGILHMSALLTDRGVSAALGAAATSVIGFSVMVGRIGTGYLLDRFFAPRLAMILFSCGALGIGLLWWGATGKLAVLAAFLIGVSMGAETDIIAYAISRYFGLSAFGTAYGYGFATFVLAGALGALLMGAGFDLTRSYTAPLVICFFFMIGAVVLMSRLGPYRFGVRTPGMASATTTSPADVELLPR